MSPEIKTEYTTESITAPNTDLEVLKANFPHCFDKNGDFDFDKFKRELQSREVDFSKENYNMDWLGKSYARLLASDPATTLLKEDKEWNNKTENQNSENILIKGDNLEALKHLSNAYHGSIKMIYIDPPYNTGTDGFVYQDDRKFTVEEFQKLAGVDTEKAKKVLSFVNSKSNSHSAWLTFMYPRLYIAKKLLKDDSIIFVSIDDNEVAQLKILMDEIFGEENFINKIVWKKNSSGKTVTEKYPENIDYLLMYGKTKKYCLQEIFKPLAASTIKSYSKNDNDDRGKYCTVSFQKTGNPGPQTTYDYIDNKGKKWLCPLKGWRMTKEKIKALENDNRIYFDGDTLREKCYWNERSNVGQIADTLWDDISENNVGTAEVDKLIGKGIFTNPKPTELVRRCADTIIQKNDQILDFFAGSGTTGEAVMQLNARDGGNRNYILVQLPEIIDPIKQKIAYDFVKNELNVEIPTIFDITKERLARAAKKIQDEQTLNNKKNENVLLFDKCLDHTKQDFGFKIFKTMPIWEDYDFKAEEFDPNIKLFDESKLNEEDIQTLLTTWKTNDNIPLTNNLIIKDLNGYIAYYGLTREEKGKLYLMHRGFATNNLKQLLEDIDSDVDFNPSSIHAFGYHFESKSLLEISENLASYSNKKGIDISFTIKY